MRILNILKNNVLSEKAEKAEKEEKAVFFGVLNFAV
jgi:hypothetical protein